MTALRMVQRMKRDWMHTGRRPSGLCGAALLVASRLHDFNRSIRDLVRIVKAARKKQKQVVEEQARLEKVSEEISKLQKKIEAELEARRQKVRGRFASVARVEGLTEEEENRISNEFIMGDTMETINACLDDSRQSNEGSNESRSFAENSLGDRLALSREENGSDQDDVCSDAGKSKQSSGVVSSLRPTAATLGLKESIEECMRVRDAVEITEESGVLDLEGLDDEELDGYIMTDAEVRLKTKFWLDTHAEYLKEMEEKEARKALEAEENANKPETKKVFQRKRRKRAPIQANTAGEAIEKMLQEKRISNKINY
ncbi:hypothetical protein HPB50_018104 [Hyalomma asiaticum]|uniref:Uncharacterized protein n=1 Tax=Hyalomma asiaticum TaxID=266040 RepID=A0ACB7RX57_HYAAI|nr:hypothetical protein HPB50_018104 [Hyalomma asiaticum]